MSTKKIAVVVTHNGCAHTAESWTIAFAQALSHAGVHMNVQSRQPTIRILMGGKVVTHQGVKFKGSLATPR